MATSRRMHPAIIIFDDVLTWLTEYYDTLPPPHETESIKSHSTRITLTNLFNQIMLQMERAQVDYHPYIRSLLQKKTSLMRAVHKAHCTTEQTHPLHVEASLTL
jgi:hypothetical protein